VEEHILAALLLIALSKADVVFIVIGGMATVAQGAVVADWISATDVTRRIAGTRITVYDVLDYFQAGWRYDQIASLVRRETDDIQAAIQYIEDHKEAVMTT
jgi:hypothetical protein